MAEISANRWKHKGMKPTGQEDAKKEKENMMNQ